jgi:hypothetical protein
LPFYFDPNLDEAPGGHEQNMSFVVGTLFKVCSQPKDASLFAA